MGAIFYLKIIASDHKFFEGECSYLVVPVEDGEKGIMAHHEDMVIALVPGELRYRLPDGTQQSVAIGSGFVQIAHNRVTLLSDFAERPEEIDEKRAQEALERAQEKLRQKQSIREYHQSQAAMARALTRLKEKRKYYNI